jgi:membrane fusion protein, hemolysin D
MTSAKKIIQFPEKRARRSEYEIAFLPAALEVVEKPPSPAGRAIGATIIAFFCLALAWAALGTVDIVATAPGKIVPAGRTKVIQPFETGVVRAIHVRDGQSVKAGELLIELDPTMSGAELEHMKSDLLAAQLDFARYRAALAETENPLDVFQPSKDATPELIEMHRQYLVSQTAEQNSKLAEIDRQLSQKEAERDTIAATIEKLQATIPLLQERVDVRKYLYTKELGSKITYLMELQDLVGQQHDLAVQKSRYREADAAVSALKETKVKIVAQYRRGLFEELTKAEQKAAGLGQDVIKAQERTRLQLLTAPIDGVVQQLVVHTVGGVVTPAQALAVVVPVESRLEIEAMVSNHDVGFVSAGQEAETKVDTFNFTRYGLLHGRVISVSQDAIAREKPADRPSSQQPTETSISSEPKGQELVYSARVSLDRTQMPVEDKLVNLSPGMAVTVEIKTGSRRILSYLLSPLARYKQEVLRER